MFSPYVVVVILNNNRYADTRNCLASLSKSTYKNYGMVVLNVRPANDQAESVFASQENLNIVNLVDNRGYAGNNNIGLHLALEQGADWVLFLNDDTLLAPDCLEQLVHAGQADDTIGLVGPMVYHYDKPGVIQSAGGVLTGQWASHHLGRNEVDTGQFAAQRNVDWLSGCALMVRRAVLTATGGFDERYFLYWEEVDLCLAARRLGWTSQHVPKAKIWHKGSLRHYQPPPYVTYYSARNLFLLLQKHHAPLSVHIYQWQQTVRTLASWTVRPKWHKMREHRNALWQAIADVLFRRWGMKV